MGEGKTFTAEEVAQHSGRDDLWFVIHGKVYDITNFMDEHPGGEEVCGAVGKKREMLDYHHVVLASRKANACGKGCPQCLYC